MKFRLSLLWAQSLFILPILQTASAATVNVNYWSQVADIWKTNPATAEFQLTSNITVAPSRNDQTIEGAMPISTGQSMTVNGKNGSERYTLTSNIPIIRDSTIVRPFIVDGGTLKLENLKFVTLFETNMSGEDPVRFQPSKRNGRSIEDGGYTRSFYACGAVVFSKSEDSVTQITNCAFNDNYIEQTTQSKTGNTAEVSGGALGGKGLFTILFSTFDSNKAVSSITAKSPLASAAGGAIYAQHLQIGNSEFTKNYVRAQESGYSDTAAPNMEVIAMGGAIAAEGGQNEIIITSSHFTGNYAQAISDQAQTTAASGGALLIADIDRATVSYCTFTGNYALASGISASAYGGAGSFSQTDFITGSIFTGNHATAIATPKQVTGIDSGATAWGGAAFGGNFDGCTFKGNYAEALTPFDEDAIPLGSSSALGGALYTASSVIKNSSFIGNYTSSAVTSLGGAIYLTPANGSFVLDIIADTQQSIFRGNRINVSLTGAGGMAMDGTANAIYIDALALAGEGSTLDFRAGSGLSVEFYDPIVVNADGAEVKLSFNRPGETGSAVYDGAIVFRGEPKLTETDSPDNRISYTSSAVSMRQYGGEVTIMDKAVLGADVNNREALAIGAQRYDMDKGLLQIITDGHLLASQMQFGAAGKENDAICTFRNGTGAQMTADSISIGHGLTVDFQPFLDTYDSGTVINANSLTLGGSLKIADKKAGYLEFYLNKRWAQTQRYLVFSLSDSAFNGKTGDFSAILSEQTGLSSVSELYGHKGSWEMKWDGNDLYAVWTADKTPVPPVDPEDPDLPVDPEPPVEPANPQIHPELAGSLVINSLWSTVSNMKALNNAALARTGLARHKMGKDINYWASGLGDFSQHRSQGSADGFDYSGFGYSVGADYLFRENNLVAGVAFGNLIGTNKSRDFAAEIDQTSYMGLLYAGWLKQLNQGTLLTIDGTASFGTTSNKLKTYYSDDRYGHGKWDNDAWRITLRATWNCALNENWTISPFIGLEYDDATQHSFTENGSRVRSFQKSTLRNLALPAGVAISNQTNCLGGMKWSNSLAVSYIPDVYRENPDAVAILTSQDYSWTVRGIKPLRNAVRVEYNTRLQLNPSWAVFAGYSLEGRKNSVYHNASAGVSCSF